MKNTHLEHPEDMILNGKESAKQVINYLLRSGSSEYVASVKYDGAPAIVWGYNPENHQFFVGTKSVFNKVKIKINYSHHDIEVNHGGTPRVAAILHVCFDNLPRVPGVYQGDFIGFGGTDTYRPNTLTYKFKEDVIDNIIIAAHTSYSGGNMKEMTAKFNPNLKDLFVGHSFNNSNCKFVDTNARFAPRSSKVDFLLGIASSLVNFIKFPDKRQADQYRVSVNKCIREQKDIDCLPGLLGITYKLVMNAKEICMRDMQTPDEVQCMIGDYECDHEGYVHTNKYGTYKFVYRRQFSYHNFTLPKQW